MTSICLDEIMEGPWICLALCILETHKLANSEDPDEMQHNTKHE